MTPLYKIEDQITDIIYDGEQDMKTKIASMVFVANLLGEQITVDDDAFDQYEDHDPELTLELEDLFMKSDPYRFAMVVEYHGIVRGFNLTLDRG